MYGDDQVVLPLVIIICTVKIAHIQMGQPESITFYVCSAYETGQLGD